MEDQSTSDRPRMKPAIDKANEKRRSIRVPIQLKIDIESPNEHYLFESASNLSQNGIFIQTEQPLELGSQVNIRFALPDSNQVRTRGEVMWVNESDEEEPGMGIKFIGLSKEDREMILAAIKKIAIL